MRYRGWKGLLLLMIPAVIWWLSYAEISVWWAENWSSVPGAIAGIYALCGGLLLFRRHWGLAGVSLLFCLLFFVRSLPDSRIQHLGRCDKTAQVLQYNLFFKNRHIENFIRFVRKSQPDLVVLQEVTPQHGEQLETLRDLYPYHYGGQPRIGYPSNQLILSRQVLYGMSVYQTPDGQKLIRGIWQPVPGLNFAVFAAHPPSPRNEQLWHRRNLMIQTVEFLTGLAPVENSLVIGDFNLSSDSIRYTRLFPGFSSLPVSSWPAVSAVPVPGIGIDHLWVRGHARICARYAIRQVSGSDHWPILTELSL